MRKRAPAIISNFVPDGLFPRARRWNVNVKQFTAEYEAAFVPNWLYPKPIAGTVSSNATSNLPLR